MLTYQDALALIATLPPGARQDSVALSEAAGRVLADDVRLARDQPPFDRSTMDGYAIRLAGEQSRFTVRASIHAGDRYAGDLAPGECVRIMTGAPCPAGTTVVPIELTDGGLEQVTVTENAALVSGRNVAWRGEDGRAGDLVVARGTRLSPTILAAVAMAGVSRPTVAAMPHLSIITTGDEVESSNEAGIRDSNGPLMSAFAMAMGLVAERAHASDDADALRLAIRAASAHADVIVTTGGVSAGDRDLVPLIASTEGFTTIFHHLAMQPGKPVLLARRGDQYLVGLPGNPVSVLATAHVILWPLLARLLGSPQPSWLQLPSTIPWHHRGKRLLFLPAKLAPGGLEPIRWNGSGDLLAAAAGDGLIELQAGQNVAAGSLLRFLPYIGGRLGDVAHLPPRQVQH